MRIVHILNSLTSGGREKVVVELCNELVKDNLITIITLSDNCNILKDCLDTHINLIELPFKNNLVGTVKLWFIGFFMMRRHLRKLQPEIVHNHLYFYDFLFLSLLLLGNKAKSFRTIHTSGLYYSKGGLKNKVRLFTEKFATILNKTYLISISNSILKNNYKFFSKYYSDNKYIPNGLNFASFVTKNIEKKGRLCTSDKFVGIYVARLDNGKNHLLIVDVLHDLKLKGEKIKFFFLGDGLLRKRIEDAIKLKDLSDEIILVGYTSDVPHYLKKVNFALFPSDFEGFPIALIEKMYYKLPIITSDIDAFSEVIINDFNGMMFSLKKPEELGTKILKIKNDPKFANELAYNAYNTALKYDIKKIANFTNQYYKNSLK